ncbi:MAG: UPF0175 family protein [Nanoarchaeota archaeon]
MDKLVSVTARLNKGAVDYIERLSVLFNIDRSTAFRMVLQRGIQEDRKEKAIEMYLQGKLTLEGAARFANIYIGDFLDLMKESGVESNLTVEDFTESLKQIKRAE